VPLPVAGYGHRVDRVDRAPGRAKGGDQQPARCLNGHRNRVLGAVPGLGQQRDEFGEALDGLDDAPPGEELTFMVEQRDVVMPLGPVDPARDLIQAVPTLPALLSLVRDRTRGALIARLCDLTSDEPFAIPATRTTPVFASELTAHVQEGVGRAGGLEPRAQP
jgi:hypothetical protein